ncbi:hypothetical protein [Comamonas sp. GB3 AK4-5]|uniref:hypothetical protein n=1 Tax=Comamonas sp. GB3 AK4-5 TaxID=3231487 RepID=UPI00351E2C78
MKIRKICSLLAFSICGFALSSHAQGDIEKPPSVAEQTKKIIEVVNLYARAIACDADDGLSGKNIAAMTPLTNMLERDEAKFAVLWNGDLGCQGGSGTSGARLAIVGVGAGDTFYVNPYESEPAVDAGLPRYVERIVGATKDTLVFDVRDYSDRDANCCPSLRQRITIRQLPNGKWQRVSTKKLPPAKD